MQTHIVEKKIEDAVEGGESLKDSIKNTAEGRTRRSLQLIQSVQSMQRRKWVKGSV